MLEIACHATEFRLFPIKQAEKGLFRWINEHTGIPYPIPQAISEPWHKVFLLVQIDLQRKGWPNKISVAGRKELFGETGRIYKLLDRVVRCLVDILGQRQDGRGVNVALDVLRSIKAKVWQGNEMELLQLEGIGAAKMEKLVQAGVKSIRQLSELECYHIERLLGRNPPFGHQLRHRLERFPQLTIRFEVLGMYEPPTTLKEDGKGGGEAVANGSLHAKEGQALWVARVILGYDNEKVPAWNGVSAWTTFVIEGDEGRLVWFWRGNVKRLEGGKEMVIGLAVRKGETLKTTFACEEIVGTMVREEFVV